MKTMFNDNVPFFTQLSSFESLTFLLPPSGNHTLTGSSDSKMGYLKPVTVSERALPWKKSWISWHQRWFKKQQQQKQTNKISPSWISTNVPKLSAVLTYTHLQAVMSSEQRTGWSGRKRRRKWCNRFPVGTSSYFSPWDSAEGRPLCSLLNTQL